MQSYLVICQLYKKKVMDEIKKANNTIVIINYDKKYYREKQRCEV